MTAADTLAASRYATPRRRRAPTPEGAILRTILDGLAAHRVRAYRLNSGATVVPETASGRPEHALLDRDLPRPRR